VCHVDVLLFCFVDDFKVGEIFFQRPDALALCFVKFGTFAHNLAVVASQDELKLTAFVTGAVGDNSFSFHVDFVFYED
jgi:hypothetical protein